MLQTYILFLIGRYFQIFTRSKTLIENRVETNDLNSDLRPKIKTFSGQSDPYTNTGLTASCIIETNINGLVPNENVFLTAYTISSVAASEGYLQHRLSFSVQGTKVIVKGNSNVGDNTNIAVKIAVLTYK